MDGVICVCISNREKYEDGITGGAWLPLPATAVQFQEALRSVDADMDNFFIYEWESFLPFLNVDPDGNPNMFEHDIDKLNYMAVQLGELEPLEIQKLNAIMCTEMGFEMIEKLIDYTYNDNSSYFVLLPNAHTATELQSEKEPQSERREESVSSELLNSRISDQADGFFTEYGYIFCSGREWEPYFENDGLVPVQYCITALTCARQRIN